jgi:hypothetical protein
MLRILLDNGILTHSEFAEPAIQQTAMHWGGTYQVSDVRGFTRKKPHRDVNYQLQMEALFTIGRLIRENAITAYTCWELECEKFRDQIGLGVCNALKGCKVHKCQAAINRSVFRQTTNLEDAFAKGGIKERKAGVELGEANQIAFLIWLRALTKTMVDEVIRNAALVKLADFDIDSLKNIAWFQFLCERSGSPENYPDVFHLWTAEHNGFNALLTLETKLPNFVCRIRNEKTRAIEINTEVLRPLDLLKKLGIQNPDPVPMDDGRFYHFHEFQS